MTITSVILQPASFRMWSWRSGVDRPGAFMKLDLRARLRGAAK